MLLPLFASAALASPEDHILRNGKGNLLHWETMPIGYRADPTNGAGLDEESTVAAIVGASGAWTELDGVAVDFRFRGTAAGLHGGYDNQNVVYFVDQWTGSSDLLALTSTWSDEAGAIVDFDMAVNTQDHTWALDGDPACVDLQNALAHEFGHALGLGHDEQDLDATMYPSAEAGEVSKRDLSPADIAVAAFLYPGTVAEDTGEVASTPDFGCSSAGFPSLFAALPAAILVTRRRKEIPCC
jgi:hypothetical protein